MCAEIQKQISTVENWTVVQRLKKSVHDLIFKFCTTRYLCTTLCIFKPMNNLTNKEYFIFHSTDFILVMCYKGSLNS